MFYDHLIQLPIPARNAQRILPIGDIGTRLASPTVIVDMVTMLKRSSRRVTDARCQLFSMISMITPKVNTKKRRIKPMDMIFFNARSIP